MPENKRLINQESKMLKRLLFPLTLLLCLAVATTSCRDDDDGLIDLPEELVSGPIRISVPENPWRIKRAADYYAFYVECQGSGWIATCESEWLTLTPTEGSESQYIRFDVGENTEPFARVAVITIADAKEPDTYRVQVRIRQSGYNDEDNATLTGDMQKKHRMGYGYDIMKEYASDGSYSDNPVLDPRELEHSSFLLVWGSNMKATRIQSMLVLAGMRKAGKRVVLIESCAEDMAPYCDGTVLIRPGTDGALALAMMHVLVREGLAAEDYLCERAWGYPAFKETLPLYTPEWAEGITGVPADVTEALAMEYGRASRPAIMLGSGPSRYGNGGMTVRLITILSALTGAWGRPGGGLCGCNPGIGPCVDDTIVTRPDFRTGQGRKVNINQLAKALNGAHGQAPIRSLYVYGSNPVGSVSSQAETVKGLMGQDLFTVVHERFMTDTARYADILLPATFSVEQSDCYLAYGYCTFGTAYKVLEPAGLCKSNWDTFRLLAGAMGYEEAYFKNTEEDMVKELLAHPGPGLAAASAADWKLLESGGVISTPFADHMDFKTETGKIMIVNPDQPEPMPRFTSAHGGEYPLRLIAVPSGYTLNSIFLEREDLTGKRGPMELMLHPMDAALRNIRDGDKVTACNDLAQVEFTARLSGRMARGAVAVSGVYGMSASGSGLLVNALHHQRLSDIGEATTLNDNTVEVRPAFYP